MGFALEKSFASLTVYIAIIMITASNILQTWHYANATLHGL